MRATRLAVFLSIREVSTTVAVAPPAARQGIVEPSQTIVRKDVGQFVSGRLLLVVILQRYWFDPLLVQADHLESAPSRYGRKIDRSIGNGRIRNLPTEYIRLEIVVHTLFRLQDDLRTRHLLTSFHIGIHLIIEAAFELGAEAREFLRIESQILIASCTRIHRHEIHLPRRAAQLAAARADTAYTAGLLSCTDLLHLHTNVESLRQYSDQLAKVYALIGDIVENGLIAIALILHISDLHIQIQIGRNLAGLDHRIVLSCLCFAVLIQIALFGYAVYLERLAVVRAVSMFAHLEFYQLTGQRHRPDVMARISLYGYYIPFVQFYLLAVEVVPFARILELYLHESAIFGQIGDVAQPVISAERLAMTPLAGILRQGGRIV